MNKLCGILKYVKPLSLNRFEIQILKRSLLSPAYQCIESWNHRNTSPILEKVNLNNLYYELEQRFLKNGVISAVDVDIFANKVQDDSHVDELLDLVHKLRMSSETTNMLNSTATAVIRYLIEVNKTEELLNVLDDRLNYGVFLDSHIANMLMDKFYKEKDFVAGCRVASQLMLQEEHEHAISTALGILHCYNYLLKPEGWPTVNLPEEPEEEVKVRVKYLRNPYNDGHFDLKDNLQIVGKTLMTFTYNKSDALHQSFTLLGLALYGKPEEAKQLIKETKNKLFFDVLQLLPESNLMKAEFSNIQMQNGDVNALLIEAVKQAELQCAEQDIAQQTMTFEQWEMKRKEALDQQIERLNIARRLDNVKKTQEELNSREEKLWFFENQEDIELAIENKRVFYPKRWFGKKKKPKKVDEGYVPPEL